MAASTKEWDLIVIGAGIVGCSAALYAARNGMSVLIVERDTPGSAQSGRNLGFVRQQGRDLRELPLAMAANHLWQEVEKDLGRSVGWFRGGNLVLAVTDEDVVKQTAWHAQAVEYGLDTVLLNPLFINMKQRYVRCICNLLSLPVVMQILLFPEVVRIELLLT